jgi:hypothetical protein
MSTNELRKKLIEKIEKIDDENLLNEVNRLIDLEIDDFGIYKFSGEQKAAIEEAQNQIKNGQFLSDEEAEKDINSFLSNL